MVKLLFYSESPSTTRWLALNLKLNYEMEVTSVFHPHDLYEILYNEEDAFDVLVIYISCPLGDIGQEWNLTISERECSLRRSFIIYVGYASDFVIRPELQENMIYMQVPFTAGELCKEIDHLLQQKEG